MPCILTQLCTCKSMMIICHHMSTTTTLMNWNKETQSWHSTLSFTRPPYSRLTMPKGGMDAATTVWRLGHFWHECQQPIGEEVKHLMDCTCQHQEELNKNGGSQSKGWLCIPGGSRTATDHGTSQGAGCSPTVNNKEWHPPYWNDDPPTHWLEPLNVSYAYINRCRERVLIDSGARCNAVSLEYGKACKLRVGPVHKLTMSPQEIPIQGIARNTNALGYVVINVQIGGIPSYNEEQVALVIEDSSCLGMREPVILGMPTIHRLCHQMKESENESAQDEW